MNLVALTACTTPVQAQIRPNSSIWRERGTQAHDQQQRGQQLLPAGKESSVFSKSLTLGKLTTRHSHTVAYICECLSSRNWFWKAVVFLFFRRTQRWLDREMEIDLIRVGEIKLHTTLQTTENSQRAKRYVKTKQ